MAAKMKPERRKRPPPHLLFDKSPEPMLLVDVETLDILEVNQAAINRYGYSAQEFQRMRLTELAPAEERDRVRDHVSRDQLESTGICDTRHLLKSGQTVEVDMLVHLIRYGKKTAALVVPQDCTRRRQLEEQLRQAQKMEAVGMLAGGIAHDFNNLLTIINGYSQMLLTSLPEKDENRSSVEQIMKAGERAAELTRQLLTFSRRQVIRPKALDLNIVVAGTAVMLRRIIGEHIELRIVAGPDLAKIHADRGQVEQVIMNLAVNSRDAMTRGGTLILETQNIDLEEPYIGPHNTLQPGRYVMMAVTDSGTGMDLQTRSRLFEPFFTTKAQGQGTGLGLSTVYGIVKQSGGEIVVYSEPGEGTCVKVYFPSVTDAVSVPEADVQQPQMAHGTETILFVEDEEAVRRLVSQTLEKQGYRLLVAGTGTEALEMAEQYSGRISLLITDVVMPRMGGKELAERLRALRPDIRILYISGYTETAILRSGSLESSEQFLQKPFTPMALSKRVRELLDKVERAQNSKKSESSGN